MNAGGFIILNTYLFYDYLWYFVIYSLIGWIGEVIFAAIKYRQLINRGFLNGPYCPIYGVGVLLVILCLSFLKNNIIILFLGSVVLTTALEAIVGIVLNHVFKKKWWDYSKEPFNFRGYICLGASLFWGAGCVLIIKFVHPLIEKFVSIIPLPLGTVFIIFFSIIIIFDVIATAASVHHLNHRLSRIDELAAHINEISNELTVAIAGNTIDFLQSGEDLKDAFEEKKNYMYNELLETGGTFKETLEDKKNHLFDNAKKKREQFTDLTKKYENLLIEKGTHTRLLRAFPDLKTHKYADALQKLKENNKIKK